MRGSENFFADIMYQPPKMTEFISLMHEFYCELLRIWSKTDVDCLNMMDDWGSQKSLLINPVAWRKIFKPMYKDYIDIAHAAGKKMFMHSDGYTLEIIPDLIELGLDAFNTQIFCMGPDKLEQFAGKIAFWGEIDRQRLLCFATPDEVAEAVRDVKNRLWKNGGCIAQLELGAGTKLENAMKAYETWLE
jgi:uroporphyrinogen-III decarboxylase